MGPARRRLEGVNTYEASNERPAGCLTHLLAALLFFSSWRPGQQVDDVLHLRVVALWPVPLVVPHLLPAPTHTSTHTSTHARQGCSRSLAGSRGRPLPPFAPSAPHLQADDVGAALPDHLGQVRHALHVPAPALPVRGTPKVSDPTTPSRQAWPAAAMMMMHVLRLWVEVGGRVGVPDVVGHHA